MKNKHVFISYSRRDSVFVQQFTETLKRSGIPVWIDSTSLTPGTPNWEQAIRTAIDEATAVILVASPDARSSVYVHGELTLAKIRLCPIYPVWAAGQEWIDCIPLDMVNYQYVDARDGRGDGAIKSLIQTLQPLFNLSDSITIGLPTHETIQLPVSTAHNFRDAINLLYLKHLQDWYEPFTYGSHWILANVATKQLAVPWEWLAQKPATISPDAVIDFMRTDYYSLNGLLQARSHWAVWDATRVKAVGIAVNEKTIIERLLSPYGLRELLLLEENVILHQADASFVRLEDYAYKMIIAIFGTKLIRNAFIQVR